MNEIGKSIRAIRLLRNLSQENIADDLKMSQQGYSKLERGERDIKFSKLEAIARILGVKIEDILSFDDKIIFKIHNNPNRNNGLPINQNQPGKEDLVKQIQNLETKVGALESKLGK